MPKLRPIAGETSLHSALGRWRQHIDFVISNPEALGVVRGAENLLNAAGGEVALSSAYGRWARYLSKACDDGNFENVLDLLQASRGERGRSLTYQWDRLASDGEITPPPTPFPDLPGLLFRYQINSTTNTGDGSEITAAQDLSGMGNVIVGGPPGQRWTYGAGRFGSDSPGGLSTNQYMITSGLGNAVVDFLNGKSAATTQLSIVIIFQQRGFTTSTWCSWYNSALFSRCLSLRTVTGAFVPQIIGGTSAGAQASISAPGTSKIFNIWHPDPTLYIYTYDGAGFDHHEFDGYEDTPIARNWAGNYSVDTFALGAGSTGAAFTAQNNAIYAEVAVYGHALSTAEKATFLPYSGSNYSCLGWKKNLGGTRPTRAYAFIGQSNCTGGCLSTQSYGSTQPFTYNLALDGIYKPLTEPSHSNVNQVTGALSWTTNQIGASKALQMSTQLKSVLGETRDTLIVPLALPGSTADSWLVNLATPTPDMVSLSGYAKHKISEALKAPFCDLIIILDQGEADCDTLLEATTWAGKWGTWRAEFNSFFAGYFAKQKHIFLAKMSNPIAGTGIFTTELRTDQQLFADTYADVAIYQRNTGTCEAAVGLHLTSSEQQTNGILNANLIFASP